jgi:hypothetical protein
MGYECLLAGLPDLKAGADSPMKMEDLLVLFGETLSKKDLDLLQMLRMTADAPEVQALMDRYDEKYGEQECWWNDARESLSEVDLRTQALYELGLSSSNQFIRDWFAFNQDMNNVLTATICRRHGFDVRKAIVGHNPVAEILRKDLPQKDFGLSAEMDNLENVMALVDIDNLMAREKQMDAIRFAWLEEKNMFVYFSIENVLAYYLQAEMLNRWAVLTVEQGEKIFRELVSDMKKGIKLQ